VLNRHAILCFSSIDWDFIWQGHQEIMATLAGRGNRVLFVENTGVRPPRPGDLSRLRQRIRNWWRGVKGFRQERENLFVFSPLVLPFPYSRVARWINARILLRALRRWMRATGFERPIVWTFLPTPLVRQLIRELDPELTIYYCIDDLTSSSAAARRIRSSEAKVFREADLVFVTSAQLRERAARFNERVHLFPFGVDFKTFERVRNQASAVPGDLERLGGPIVGYVGGVHKWLDQELLALVAERIPDASFALVGPVQTDVSRLGRCANIHLLGAKSHADVPRYIKGFGVAVIPYRLAAYTTHVYPTKLNEYLAMGVPVVTTDLPEIRRFNLEHGEVVRVAQTPEDFADGIRQAIDKVSAVETERRIEVARENSWDRRIDRMSELIENALAKRPAATAQWEERLRHLYRTARRRTLKTVTGFAAAYLLLFYTPFVWLVAEPLRVTHPAGPADAIVVFAGGVGESGKAGGGYQERVRHAIDLYRQGHASHLVFSSGFTFAFREAEVMRQLAVASGVPASAIVLETRAANTYENVRFVDELLEQRGWLRVLLVSSPYHRRALLTWRKTAPHISVVSSPPSASQFYHHEWGASLEQIRGIAQEYVAIAVYWWRGWL